MAVGEQTAREAYDVLAGAYDELTAGYAHERWLLRLEALATEHGLRGRRLLDVACGTGKSFLPLLARGYEVHACDVSPAMLARAAVKTDRATLFEADMRRLPDVGEFDLVTCLDDALNYLEDPAGVRDTLAGLRRALAPGGIAIFDVNTPAMYRTGFAETRAHAGDTSFLVWRGGASASFAPGDPAEAIVDVFALAGGDRWTHARSHHRQRHWPAAELCALAREAGLRILAVHGQHRGARIEPRLDEDVHPKAVFITCRDEGEREGVHAMRIGSP
jgi:SAM-dependent methyltransferase